jgi:hypothetical protein
MLKFPKLALNNIFDLYDKDELIPKLKQLKYFCFLRGRLNSYVTDGDEIIVHIKYIDKSDLLFKLESLGMKAKRLNSSDEISYGKPWPDCLNYPTPSKQFPDIAEPSKQKIFDEDVLIYIGDSYFTISMCNSDKAKWYLVNDAQIISAKKIEINLEKIGLDKSVTTDAQREFGRYINRYHYPELFID